MSTKRASDGQLLAYFKSFVCNDDNREISNPLMDRLLSAVLLQGRFPNVKQLRDPPP